MTDPAIEIATRYFPEVNPSAKPVSADVSKMAAFFQSGNLTLTATQQGNHDTLNDQFTGWS